MISLINIRNRIWFWTAGFAVTLLCVATSVAGANVTLAWDGNSEPNISGYKVYYGRVSQTYPFVIDAGSNTTQVISNLEDGITYYFAVTAYDAFGQESDFSGEIPYTIPLQSIRTLADGSLRIRFQGVPARTYRVEYTESLTEPNWKTLGIRAAGSNGSLEIIDQPTAASPARFYRSVHPAR
jgi:hypothetical protein